MDEIKKPKIKNAKHNPESGQFSGAGNKVELKHSPEQIKQVRSKLKDMGFGPSGNANHTPKNNGGKFVGVKSGVSTKQQRAPFTDEYASKTNQNLQNREYEEEIRHQGRKNKYGEDLNDISLGGTFGKWDKEDLTRDKTNLERSKVRNEQLKLNQANHDLDKGNFQSRVYEDLTESNPKGRDYDYEVVRDMAYYHGYNPKNNPEGAAEYAKSHIKPENFDELYDLYDRSRNDPGSITKKDNIRRGFLEGRIDEDRYNEFNKSWDSAQKLNQMGFGPGEDNGGDFRRLNISDEEADNEISEAIEHMQKLKPDQTLTSKDVFEDLTETYEENPKLRAKVEEAVNKLNNPESEPEYDEEGLYNVDPDSPNYSWKKDVMSRPQLLDGSINVMMNENPEKYDYDAVEGKDWNEYQLRKGNIHNDLFKELLNEGFTYEEANDVLDRWLGTEEEDRQAWEGAGWPINSSAKGSENIPDVVEDEETTKKLNEMGFGPGENKKHVTQKDITDFEDNHPFEVIYDYDDDGNRNGYEIKFRNPKDQEDYEKLIDEYVNGIHEAEEPYSDEENVKKN